MILKTIPAAPFAKERLVSLFYFEYLLGSANAEQFGQECFISCEKVSASVPCANKGLCPFETYDPFKKVSIPNFLDRFFDHAGVLAVFKPRRGRLKIPVAPTGKLKLHVFPLRRAKENKGFSPLDTHKPLKRLDLNFLASLFGSFLAI